MQQAPPKIDELVVGLREQHFQLRNLVPSTSQETTAHPTLHLRHGQIIQYCQELSQELSHFTLVATGDFVVYCPRATM
jgi:hypothetical protein